MQNNCLTGEHEETVIAKVVQHNPQQTKLVHQVAGSLWKWQTNSAVVELMWGALL
jgi:hypothetical protein